MRLEILNLVSTGGIATTPMANYGFVSDSIVSQMDTIAGVVKQEITSMMNRREGTLQELRVNDQELAMLNTRNQALRKQMEDLRKELISLTS